ncbi:hypothetical protein PhCBS80983_g02661 [Powellomyces hirtus]|uniref:Peptidase S9 prolyl oligopeptidase catalytic domain-containing protein n=1 Tax=Powellomyces hirtus TaxID=109895 RepID=A0A507E5N6_9FUNG|nr:hypothetical protein PhCBS80983_g02661 [Powellomyces hirtus]
MSSTSAEPKPTKLIIGGLEVFVFGLDALPSTGNTPVSVVFFAHGRLGSAVESFRFCQDLYRNLTPTPTTNIRPLVVLFDQRNHGSRLVSHKHNDAWKQGNPTHAWDMYALQYGTAMDVSFLIDMLPGILHRDVERWGVCGISLGGHATLLVMANEPRVTTGVAIIGCGDYLSLMTHRAGRMEPPIVLPPHSSTHMNEQLLRLLKEKDPVNRAAHFKGKSVLLLNGGADKLVPPECNHKLIENLNGVFSDHGKNKFEVVVEQGVRHEVTDAMKSRCADWLNSWLNAREAGTSRM